jgi:hypothetical protein
MTELPVSPAYREAVKNAILPQILITLLLSTLLDGGTLAKIGGAAMIGFWIGVAFIMIRRPRSPSTFDLWYIRRGYYILLIVGITFMPFMGMLRTGHWNR